MNALRPPARCSHAHNGEVAEAGKSSAGMLLSSASNTSCEETSCERLRGLHAKTLVLLLHQDLFFQARLEPVQTELYN